MSQIEWKIEAKLHLSLVLINHSLESKHPNLLNDLWGHMRPQDDHTVDLRLHSDDANEALRSLMRKVSAVKYQTIAYHK
jgi:hypothetical protein